jgi:methionine-rich copper-binding protein CopC
VALAALALPAGASAHATLRSTTPHFGHEVQSMPPLIRLHFDQRVKILPGAIHVLNGVGKDFAGPSRVVGTNVVASVRPGRPGAYTVRWTAISADSHVVSGVWTFGFGVPAPAINAAYGAGGPTTTEHVVRWLWFLGLALAVGALGFRLICLRGLDVPLALERRIAVAAGLGAVVSLQAGIAAFSLRAEDALQLPFGRFLYGDLSPMAATRFGEAFVVMTLGFAFVLALVYLSWLLDRVDFLVPAFVLSVGLLAGLSLSGHDAVDGGSGCTSPRRRCGSAGSRRWRCSSGPERRTFAGRRLPASRGSRPFSSHSSSSPGRTSASFGCRTSATCGHAATGRCCS